MTRGSATIGLRAATPADRPFLLAVYASTREDELAAVPWPQPQKVAFVAQQFEAQSAHYGREYADASVDVVEVDGADAGRLIVHRSAVEILIVDIALLPPYRGRGIGTRLLRPLLEDADERGLPVAIHVERFNPAMRLYERLGFALAEEDDGGIYLLFRRPPQTAQPKTAS